MLWLYLYACEANYSPQNIPVTETEPQKNKRSMTQMRNPTINKMRVASTALALFSLLITCIPHAAAENQANTPARPDIQAASTPSQAEADRARVAEEFGKLPLSFEQNLGQTDKAVRFVARNPRYTLFLTDNEVVFALRKFEGEKKVRRQVLRMRLDGANTQPQVEGRDELAGKSNYIIGSDSAQWQHGVNNYARVAYHEIYPGIDMVYYGQQQQLEYDFIVAPQADTQAIRLAFKGASKVMIDKQGDLHLKLGDKELVQPAPFIYQEMNGERKQIAGRRPAGGRRLERGWQRHGRSLSSIRRPVLPD